MAEGEPRAAAETDTCSIDKGEGNGISAAATADGEVAAGASERIVSPSRSSRSSRQRGEERGLVVAVSSRQQQFRHERQRRPRQQQQHTGDKEEEEEEIEEEEQKTQTKKRQQRRKHEGHDEVEDAVMEGLITSGRPKNSTTSNTTNGRQHNSGMLGRVSPPSLSTSRWSARKSGNEDGGEEDEEQQRQQRGRNSRRKKKEEEVTAAESEEGEKEASLSDGADAGTSGEDEGRPEEQHAIAFGRGGSARLSNRDKVKNKNRIENGGGGERRSSSRTRDVVAEKERGRICTATVASRGLRKRRKVEDGMHAGSVLSSSDEEEKYEAEDASGAAASAGASPADGVCGVRGRKGRGVAGVCDRLRGRRGHNPRGGSKIDRRRFGRQPPRSARQERVDDFGVGGGDVSSGSTNRSCGEAETTTTRQRRRRGQGKRRKEELKSVGRKMGEDNEQTDIWYDDYFCFNECNVQDELLLDVLVATIKKSRAQHYYGSTTAIEGQHEHQHLQNAKSIASQQEEEAAQSTREDRPQREKALSFLASLRKAGVIARKSGGVTASLAPTGGGEVRRDKKRVQTKKERAYAAATAAEFERAEATLRTLTSDALLIKKAWAYVAEEAYEAQLAAAAVSPDVPTATSAAGVHCVSATSSTGITNQGRKQQEATASRAEQRQQKSLGDEGSVLSKDNVAPAADTAAPAAAAAAGKASGDGASADAHTLPQNDREIKGTPAFASAEKSTQIEGGRRVGRQEGESDTKEEENVKVGMSPVTVVSKQLVQSSVASFLMPIFSLDTSPDDAVMLAAAAAAQAAAQAANEEEAGAEPREAGLRTRWQKYVLLRRQRLAMEIRIQELIRLQEQQNGHIPPGGQKRQQRLERGDGEKFSVDVTRRTVVPEGGDGLASRVAGLSFSATGPNMASGGVSSVAAAFMAAKGGFSEKEELTGQQKLEQAATGAHKQRASADRHEKEDEEEEVRKTVKSEPKVEIERRVFLKMPAAVDASDTAKTTADASPTVGGNCSTPAAATPACLSPNQAAVAATDARDDVSKVCPLESANSLQQELKKELVAAEQQAKDNRITSEAKFEGIDEGEKGGGGADGIRRHGGPGTAAEHTDAAVDPEGMVRWKAGGVRKVAAEGNDVCCALRNHESVKGEQGGRDGGEKSFEAREGKKRHEGSRNVPGSSSRRSRSRTPCGEEGSSRSSSLRVEQEEEDGEEECGTHEKEEEKAEKLLRKLTQADADESLTSSSSSSPPSENGSSEEEDSLYEEDTALDEPPSSPEEECTKEKKGSHNKQGIVKEDKEHSEAVLTATAEEKGKRTNGGAGGAQIGAARERGTIVAAGILDSEGDAEEDDMEQEAHDGLQRNAKGNSGPKGEVAKERKSGRNKEKRGETLSIGSLSDAGADPAVAANVAAKKKKLSTAAKLRLRWEREKQKKRLKAGETIMEDVFARCSAAPLSIDQATKIKNLSVPSTLLSRPHCLYTVEDEWEKLYCRNYPNGLLRRGTLATHTFRIEETLEFFLFCRFLNLFASTIDIQWTFDSLVAGFACVSPLPPFRAADAATASPRCGATASGTQDKLTGGDDSGALADSQPMLSQKLENPESRLSHEAASSSNKSSDGSVVVGGKHDTNNNDDRCARSASESGGLEGNTEDSSRRTACNNYGNSGNTELFRLLLQKIFSFVGRRFSPGMSLVRMCGRYVEEKRKEGVLPVGMLWPFDYSFKFCAMKRAGRDKESGVRDSSSGEASNRTSLAKEINEGTSGDGGTITNRKGDSTSAAEINSTTEGKSEDSASYLKETGDIQERTSSSNSTGKKGALAPSSSRNSVKGSREDDEAGGGESVLMESVYNPFKLCDEWNQLKSIHKLRVIRLLIDQVLSESSQIQKARKKLSDGDLESGYKGTDGLGKLYWLVPQCGDESVFKLYREDPKTQRVEILCEDLAGLESVAEALGVDEETADMKDVLLRCHEDLLIQEKQKSRELRRDKARRRQLEISAWGLPSSARRERKPVDYTYAAYDGALDSRTPASTAATSATEGQRLDRGERLRARLAKKEERMTADALDVTEGSGDAAVADGSSISGASKQSASSVKNLSDTRKPMRKKQLKGAAVVLRSQADVLRQHQAYLMQHRHHSNLALQQSQALLLSQHLQRLQDDTDATARQDGSGAALRIHQQQQPQPFLEAVDNNAGLICSGPAAVAQLPQAALAVLHQRLQQVHHHLLQQEGLTPQQRQAALHHAWARLQAELLARYGIVSAERHAAPPQLQQQLLQQHLLRQQQQQQARQQMQQQQHAMHQHLQHLQEQAQRQQFLHPPQQQHHHHQMLQHNVQDSGVLGGRAAVLQQSYQAQRLNVARAGGGPLPHQQAQHPSYAATQLNSAVHSTNGAPPINAISFSVDAVSEPPYTGLVRQPAGGIEASACRVESVDTTRHATLMYGGGGPRNSCSGSCDKQDATHSRSSNTGYVPERRSTHVDASGCPVTPLGPATGTGYTQGSSTASVVEGGAAPSGAGPPPGNQQYAMWGCAAGRSSNTSPTPAVLSRSADELPSHASTPSHVPNPHSLPPFCSNLSSHVSLVTARPSINTGLPTQESTSHAAAHLIQSRLDCSFMPSSVSQPRDMSQSSNSVPAHVDAAQPATHAFPFRATECGAQGGKLPAHP